MAPTLKDLLSVGITPTPLAGQGLTLDGNGRIPQSVLPSSYGTAFPASPTANQTHVLVDSVTAPTYTWTMRYNANSTNADKWEFVGGASAFVHDAGSRQNTVDNVWEFIAGMPSFTLPRAGKYRYHFSSMFNGNNGVTAYMTLGTTAAGNLIGTSYIQTSTGNSFGANQQWRQSTMQTDVTAGTTRAAGDIVGTVIQSGAHTNTQWGPTWLEILPIRLS